MATVAAMAEDTMRTGSRHSRRAASAKDDPAGKATGRLGLEDGSSAAFITAVDAVAAALKAAGIAAVPDAQGAAPAMRLRCPGFDVQMRLRRPALTPSRRQRADLLQPAALLDLAVLPATSASAAREDAETVLAVLLRHLVPQLETVSVEWLGTGVLLTGEQFLEACEQPPESPADTLRLQKPVRPARVTPRAGGAGPGARPRGRACFAPVELAARRLDAQCEEVLRQVQAANADCSAEYPAGQAPGSNPAPAPGPALLRRAVSLLPRLSTLLRRPAPGSARANQLRFAGQVLLMAFLVFFAETTGVVQAALPLLP